MLQTQPNQSLPEVIRMQAQKGFRAHIDGKFGIVNPGDVVDVPRPLAMELRAAGKAFMTDADVKRQKEYLPERKKAGKAAGDPVAKQIALLTDAVGKLTELVVNSLKPAKA